MRHAAALILLALAALARADGPPLASASAAYARPFHKLTAADAYRLAGRRGLWSVRVEAAGRRGDGPMVCGCESPDGVERTCWLRPVQEADAEMTVEATLHVYRGPGRLIRGRWFAEVVEYRLTDAVRR